MCASQLSAETTLSRSDETVWPKFGCCYSVATAWNRAFYFQESLSLDTEVAGIQSSIQATMQNV